MKVIVYKKNDGVAVVWPAEGFSIEEVSLKGVPIGTEFRAIEHTELPDKAFRDAWELDVDFKIKQNIDKCKTIFNERLRATAIFDIKKIDEQLLFEGNADKIKSLTDKKKAISDLSKLSIDALATPEQIKAQWPSNLSFDIYGVKKDVVG
jgi:hypothetical protein